MTGTSVREALERIQAAGVVRGVNLAAIEAQQIASQGPKPRRRRAAITEKEFTSMIIAAARRHGWLVAHFRTARTVDRNGRVRFLTPVQGDGAGFLDLELVRRSRLIKAELKVGKNRPTPEQKRWLAAYEAAGIECYVWHPDDITRILKTLR